MFFRLNYDTKYTDTTHSQIADTIGLVVNKHCDVEILWDG